MNTARAGHTATTIGVSGTVVTLLIAGGDTTGTVELDTFDYSSNTLTVSGSATWPTARSLHSAVLLPDGQTVLLAGGTFISNATNTQTAELFQIASASSITVSSPTFVTTATPVSMNYPHYNSGVLLNNATAFFGDLSGTDLYLPAFDPVGTVTLTPLDGTDTLAGSPCTLVPGNTGNSTCSGTDTPTANPGTHTVNSTYAGPGEHSTPPSTSATFTAGYQTITFPAFNPGTVTFGVAPIALNATASSGLTVTYTVVGPATIANNTLTLTGAGQVTVTATQVGNGSWAAASMSQSLTVLSAPVTLPAWSPSAPNITYGTQLVVGDMNMAVPTVMINGVSTQVPGSYAYTYVTASSGGASLAGQTVTTGSSAPVLNAGTVTLLATYTISDNTDYTSGGTNSATLTATTTITIAKAQLTILPWTPAAMTYGTLIGSSQLTALAPIWTTGGTPATVAGTPVYSYFSGAYAQGGTKTALTGTVQPAVALDAGTVTLSYSFTPTDTTDYIAPASVNGTFAINPAPSASMTTYDVIPTATAGTLTYTLTATVTSPIATNCSASNCPLPTGTIQFMNGTTAIGSPVTLSSSTGTPTASYTTVATDIATPSSGTQTYTITAVYSGDLDYGSSAASGSTISGPAITVAATQTQASTSFSEIQLAVPVTIPTNYSFNKSCQVYAVGVTTADSSFGCAVASGSTAGTVTVTITNQSTTASNKAHLHPTFALLGLPFFGFVLFGFHAGLRQKKTMFWFLMAVLVLSFMMLSACGSGSFHGGTAQNGNAVPGNYVATVTASSASTTTTIAVVPIQLTN
jgi:hypothetical protein